MMVYYEGLDLPEKSCVNCKSCEYDSFHDETYCSHKPQPEGICGNGTVDNGGHCDYWEDKP